MSLTKDSIHRALSAAPAPGGGDLAAALKWSTVCDTYASIRLALPASTSRENLERAAAVAHRAVGVEAGAALDSFIVEFVDDAGTVVHTKRFGQMKAEPGAHSPSTGPSAPPPASRAPTPQPAARPLPGVRHIIAVGAGKGGVGKSTVAVNLAVGLARRGHAVGLMDGDIYGPSLPTMLGLAALETAVLAGRLQPFLVHGVKAMTIGKLVEPDKPLIWRGPMAHGAFKQLTEQTQWGELDYLVIDLPPGTGDVALTMAQMLQLTGAVIVCTPQKVAQDDAVRATRMFQQLGIPILGVVENMSHFIGDDGKLYDLFGKGGAEQMAQRLNLPFLGAVPVTMALRQNSDSGNPAANFTGGGPLAAALEGLVTSLESQVALASMAQGSARPTLTIS